MPYAMTEAGTRRPLTWRQDADGKLLLKCAAHADLTAKTPYLIRATTGGYVTMGLTDTGIDTLTAAAHNGFYLGVPLTAITSNNDGYLQIGGYISTVTTASITGTAGGMFRLVDASVANGGAGSTDVGLVADFAVCQTSASGSTVHDMYLLARHVCGIT